MKKKIRQPVKNGVAKVPVIMQLEALECGAVSLCMVLAYYGKWVPLEQVRADCGVSRDGSNALNIYKAAEHYGFNVRAQRRSASQLKEEGTFPCILFWNMNHFVVLNGFKGKYVCLNDPARGNVKIGWEEFSQSYTGVVITPVPGESFEPGGRPKSMLAFAKKRLMEARAAVVFVLLTTAISYLFGIANSVTSRIFMDQLLTGLSPEWLYPFIGMMVLLALIQIVVSWVKEINALKLNGKMAAAGSMAYMWKVLHMPMEFFSQRMSGDIQSRLDLNASIAGTLVNTFAPMVLNVIMMGVYLVLMLKQSVLLTAIGIFTLLINILMARVISEKRINITRAQQRDQGMMWGTMVSGIAMIETIKASGAENGFFQKWAGYQASLNTKSVESEKLNQFLGSVPGMLATLANYLVLALGVLLVMRGRISLGGVMMFQGLLSSFMDPAMTTVNAGQTIQEMRTSMERVEDVMEYPDDKGLEESEKADSAPVSKLSGNLELRNVTFGYAPLAEPLIQDFSLCLKAGQRVALVGSSGCGKSTIARLISGLYQPWSGEILFDGKPRSSYPHEIMIGSVAVVDQDITVFEDTIANNVRMWDDSIMDFEIILAARDAQIHDDIVRMTGGYQHRLLNEGQDMSGGQRQRIEIARALAQDPTIVILDEATSALDARTENEVMKAVVARGITCVVIAHRLSTVRDCDEIIVLDHGKVVERGTHAQLMVKGGFYADLVAGE
ncbi:MAG: NHLP family bacteriocin export ABC transporter peptidase/permease/ATPase subunit [Clostridia bacterium]|nr:NHLP family bacteriocin export ABC transporter peptidase/permease/ATPase subunit [Clostridia bacterium]